MTVDSLRERRDRALGAGAELFYDPPIEIVRGEGAYLFDRDGRRYVDLYNNVPSVGHGNTVVARAMAEQQSTLNTHSRYLHEGIVSFAERTVNLHHDGIESMVVSCTGPEANDVALTMARIVTGQRGIVCTGSAYHGSAGLTGALTFVGDEPVAGREIAGFPYPDLYRPLLEGVDEAALASAYLERVAAAIDHLKRDGAGFAALIVCSIFANEGLPDVPRGLMPAIESLVRREGGLLIADEVQCGHGRTGHWWGYQAMDFVPDIVVMGKPMGNGLPLAATADLLSRAAEVGASLLAALKPWQQSHPLVGDVRGNGLFLSVEMVRDKTSREPYPEAARRAANRLKELGCLVAAAGALDNAIKIRPPLVFGEEHAAEFLEAFSTCMAEMDA